MPSLLPINQRACFIIFPNFIYFSDLLPFLAVVSTRLILSLKYKKKITAPHTQSVVIVTPVGRRPLELQKKVSHTIHKWIFGCFFDVTQTESGSKLKLIKF